MYCCACLCSSCSDGSTACCLVYASSWLQKAILWMLSCLIAWLHLHLHIHVWSMLPEQHAMVAVGSNLWQCLCLCHSRTVCSDCNETRVARCPSHAANGDLNLHGQKDESSWTNLQAHWHVRMSCTMQSVTPATLQALCYSCMPQLPHSATTAVATVVRLLPLSHVATECYCCMLLGDLCEGLVCKTYTGQQE